MLETCVSSGLVRQAGPASASLSEISIGVASAADCASGGSSLSSISSLRPLVCVRAAVEPRLVTCLVLVFVYAASSFLAVGLPRDFGLAFGGYLSAL